VLGDPTNEKLTEICIGYGWMSGEEHGPFDLLPLLLEAPGYEPELFELPPDLRVTVDITHNNYPELAELQLQWYLVPALSCTFFVFFVSSAGLG
jgi:nitric-oxide synthase